MKKIFCILLLIAGAVLFLNHFSHLTPSEKAHCLATSTDKSICQ